MGETDLLAEFLDTLAQLLADALDFLTDALDRLVHVLAQGLDILAQVGDTPVEFLWGLGLNSRGVGCFGHGSLLVKNIS